MVKLKSSGFTIVELLITIALFGVIVPLFTVGINNLTALNNRARDLTLVNTLAQNRYELLRSAGYNSISEGTFDFSGDLPTELAEPKSASYTVVSPTAGIKEVTVNISYHEYQGQRDVEYKSLISELGIAQ